MPKNTPALSTFLLTMIYISTVLSIRNWPMSAEYGLSSLVVLFLAAITFLVPVALVSAELGTKWPESGGIYAWVKKAFGHKWGLIATWFVWISNVVWYPTLLSFIGSAMLYGFSVKLAQDAKVLFGLTICSFWFLTWLNLKELKVSGWVSAICLLVGTIIPALLLIFFGMGWILNGEPIHIEMSWKNVIPEFSGLSAFVFFAGLLLGFAGMEMPAVHANEVKNPQKSFPKAIGFATVAIVIFSLLGTFVVGALLPKAQINFVTASLDAMAILLSYYGLSGLLPLITLLIAAGALGGVSSWIAGPSKGLLVAAGESSVPDFFKRSNQHGRPAGILIVQAIIVSCMASVFLVMPSITSSFWLLTALASQLYLVTYSIVFIAAIYLRFKYPNTQGSYQISRGKWGLLIVCGIGLISSILTICIGFIPPAQISVGNPLFYTLFLLAGIVVAAIVPLLFKDAKKSVIVF